MDQSSSKTQQTVKKYLTPKKLLVQWLVLKKVSHVGNYFGIQAILYSGYYNLL
jgi:hypothetical protein